MIGIIHELNQYVFKHILFNKNIYVSVNVYMRIT